MSEGESASDDQHLSERQQNLGVNSRVSSGRFSVAGLLLRRTPDNRRRTSSGSRIGGILTIVKPQRTLSPDKNLLLPDNSTLEDYGRIKAELARAGTPIPENDIRIAAAAKGLALPLVTRDQHFGLIAGLVLLRW